MVIKIQITVKKVKFLDTHFIPAMMSVKFMNVIDFISMRWKAF